MGDTPKIISDWEMGRLKSQFPPPETTFLRTVLSAGWVGHMIY